MADRVLEKVCKDRGMVVVKQEEHELKLWEVVRLRDLLGHGGTNAILRFASGLAAIRPELLVFPKCLATKLTLYER